MTALSVNVNKVALLRNSRPLPYPDVVAAARIAIEAGAGGITVHPRPDQRHIRPDDVVQIAALLRRDFPGVELNIEGNPFEVGYMQIVSAVRPDQCTLVPDSPEQSTSDHGWNPYQDRIRLLEAIAALREHADRISLFMDASIEWIEAIADCRPDRIELYTEPYAAAWSGAGREAVCDHFAECARLATGLGLGVNAGHDLTAANLGPLLTAAPQIQEVSIGHALIADAIFDGLGATVRRYCAIIEEARRSAQ